LCAVAAFIIGVTTVITNAATKTRRASPNRQLKRAESALATDSNRTMKSLTLQPVLVVLLALTASVVSAQQKQPNRELAHVPPSVRQAVQARLGDAKLQSIDKETHDGETTYDVEIVRNGKERGFTLDASGALLDEEVFLPELPPAVQRAIQAHSAGATLHEIDRSINDGEISYDVEIERNAVSRDFTVDANGVLLREQVFIGELPPAVRQTIQKEAGTATVGDIDRATMDGELRFDLELTQAGRPALRSASDGGGTRSLSVGADGNLIDKQVFLVELPAPLQEAIRSQAGADCEIHQCFDDNQVTYDADAGNRTLSFDVDGKLLSTEEDVKLAGTPQLVQDQIKKLAASGKVIAIRKLVEDNETSYDVELESGSGQKTVSLGPDGKVLPADGNR
jgi:uncharacterized membrane protein YkoI